jgi:putative flippase GtrA
VADAVTLFAIGLVAREVAILWNFMLDDAITFRDLRAATRRGRFRRLVRFQMASIASFLVYLGVLGLMLAAGFTGTFSTLVAILVGFVANWLSNRHWTYAAAVEEDAPDG